MNWLANAAAFLTALVAMEGVANLSHRWLMHGPLWIWHRSHHCPPRGSLELNDLFAVVFSLPSVALIYWGVEHEPLALWAGLGIAAYGLLYFLIHDVLVHGRLGRPLLPAALPLRPGGRRYLRRVVHAHRLHHASRQRRGAVSFGFLWAPSAAVLRARMRRLEARGYRFDAYRQAGGAVGSANRASSSGS